MLQSIVVPDFVPREGVMSKLFDDIHSISKHELDVEVARARPPKQLRRFGHPALMDFPSIDGDAFEKLKENIRREGQRRLIAMRDGYIWDGRARYRACLDLNLVPRVFIHRRGDPVQYLTRYFDVFGRPHVDERYAAGVAKLEYIKSPEWKKRERENRSGWMDYAREQFKQLTRRPQPCAVCLLSSEYSHAHHSLPLHVQYDLGIEDAIHEHDWVCPVHHKELHRDLSAEIFGTRYSGGHDYSHRYPNKDAWRQAEARAVALVAKARNLFKQAGGVPVRGEDRR